MTGSIADPDFPPLWSGQRARDDRRAFAEAVEAARSGAIGAGDVIWSGHEPVVDVAFVLEPEHVLERSLQIWPLAMVACGDMIGALAPPQVAATYEFPGQILVNGGQAGAIRVTSAPCARDAVPDWMVVGLHLRLMFDGSDQEPGMIPDQTSLMEEGCGEMDRSKIIDSFSRHFLTWIYKWQDSGFAEAHRDYDARLEKTEDRTRVWTSGQAVEVICQGLDENGSLLARTDDGETRLMWLGDYLDDCQFGAREREAAS